MSPWEKLEKVPAWCKQAIIVESKAIQERKVEEDRSPLEFRIQNGSAIGPLQFEAIVAYNWRTGEIIPAKSLADGRKGGFKGASLCHKYKAYTGNLDSGKFKKDDSVELISPKNLLAYTYKRQSAKIADIGENFILLKGANMRAYPPAELGKVYILSQTDDRNLPFYNALNVCPNVPNKLTEKPCILPAPPRDALPYTKDLDTATKKAFTLAISGNEVVGIQGPPGTGKTHLLARIASYYIEKGLRVAVLSLSHNAVINALNAIQEELNRQGCKKPIFKNGSSMKGLDDKIEQLSKTTPNPICYGATLHAAAGFCGQAKTKEDLLHDSTFLSKQRDVVLIDEAGQAPAYLVFALTFLAPKMILFGDQAQLPPIIQGEHADNPTACSSMEFLIKYKGPDWVQPLLISHRMNSEICQAIKSCFYPKLPLVAGSNMHTKYEPAKNTLITNRGIDFVNVAHRNRSSRSPEEIAVAGNICQELLHGSWKQQKNGKEVILKVQPDDIVVLTPYRCQKRSLDIKLKPLGISRIGTVHSMQGQGAPIVIFSLTASSQQTIARMSEWLFEPSSWNVLISRAQAKVIILGSLDAIKKYHATSWEGLKAKNKILQQIILNPNVCNIIDL